MGRMCFGSIEWQARHFNKMKFHPINDIQDLAQLLMQATIEHIHSLGCCIDKNGNDLHEGLALYLKLRGGQRLVLIVEAEYLDDWLRASYAPFQAT